jgi:hypothetical protein
LEDLRDETVNRVRVLEELDDELLPELVDLRRRLARLIAAHPINVPHNDPESLASFDAIAGAPPEPLNYRAEGACCGRLLAILQSLVPDNVEDASELDHWTVELYNARSRWDHASRWPHSRDARFGRIGIASP